MDDAQSPEHEPADRGPTDTTVRRARLSAVGVCLLGLVLGAVVVFLLPRSWLFVDSAVGDGHSEHGHDEAQYACPMFCVVVDELPQSGKCPVCGMTMTAVSAKSSLDRHEQRMVGLEAANVRRLPLVRDIRIVGEVDYDETRIARITTRSAGWLETVWVDSTWTSVEQGEPLAAIYSPEIYAAEQEYLVALGAAERSSALNDAGSLLRAAERRLELLGVGTREVELLRDAGSPRDSVVLRAPHEGTVVERGAVEGASVAKGASLYTVADLSRVWVQGLVFQSDLPWVRVGQSVVLESDEGPAGFGGTVAFVDPVIDRRTRTARVRIEVENPADDSGRRPLRIGQRVDARLLARIDSRGRLATPATPVPSEPLAVPRAAVLRTGERSLVYVLFTETETAEGRTRSYRLDPGNLPDVLWYEPVQVRIGPLARVAGGSIADEYYPVLGVVRSSRVGDGPAGATPQPMSLTRLDEGVTVVSKGNLLLDSQAQLSGKPSLLFPLGNRGSPADPHSGH